jgi:hypothetical protein
MIVFDLHCDHGHRFEGWFGSSGDFDTQQDRGLVVCPECGSAVVGKAPMAPAVPRKGNRVEQADRRTAPMTSGEIPAEVRKAMKALAEAQKKALAQSKWVGDGFAEESRAMHYGEKDLEAIHGKATLKEAKELLDEGIEVAPLPFPIAEPDKLN